MRRGTLLTQVITVNLLLIAAAVLAAAIASNPGSELGDRETIGIVLGFALAVTVAVNVFLLSRRFDPLERLIGEMERADLSKPDAARVATAVAGSEEVERLSRTFRDLLERLDAERRAGAQAALQAQERERARIALDLHDEVNQSLTGLLLRIEAMRRTAPEEIRTELAETSAVASQAMEELLALARQLRPTMLDDLGLAAAMQALTAETGRRRGIRVVFETSGPVEEAHEDLQIAVYRIAQEALSNAVQHSSAEHVRVRLAVAGGRLELRVSDDGHGFDPGVRRGGLGMAGMRERALLVGGTLAVDSVHDAGTRVTLRAPSADEGIDEGSDRR